ncbi:MAG: acyl carrier protein [Lachnospiraceae bacterium]|nr:acyl carrier protein [Lachnospiraceae bacterium]
MDETRQTLLEILEDLHPDIDFETEDQLIEGNILDSFDIVTLVTEIGDSFDVEITAGELVPENFNSLEAMVELIEKKLEED